MKEEFLHYLWKYCLYDPESLCDPSGKRIEVLRPGEYNRDAGPDFFNARISIGGTVWAGNVEIHILSSHWDAHGHHRNRAFDNVILHVVSVNDRKVFNTRGDELLTAELAFNPELYDRYLSLVNNPCIIACQENIAGIDGFLLRHWLSSLVIERIRTRAESVGSILSETGNDWEETFYRLLSRYFGFRINTEPFELLAKALPFRIIRKHADNLFQIEALLFGTAGMLEETLFRDALADTYYSDLAREFRILAAKYELRPVHGWLWKFSRLRPANFPTIRIAQLAVMLSMAGGLFSKVIETERTGELMALFEVRASEYWDDHFIFGRKSNYRVKNAGRQANAILLINAVIPVIFVYGKYTDNNRYCERALQFLEEMAPEDNSIIDEWRDAGLRVDSAFSTQALIHLRNEYCKKRKCLDCRIGNFLISRGVKLRDQEELILEP